MSMLAAIEGRVRLMLSRAIVRLVDDARLAQELQLDLLEDEGQDGVEHLQPYGLASHPHPGAEAIVGCVGGLRSHAVVLVAADRRYRLKNLQKGEVALYDDLGNVVLLGRNQITITAQSKIAMTAPDGIAITGDIDLTGKLTASDDVVAGGISLMTHKHSGVTAGSAQTGGPV